MVTLYVDYDCSVKSVTITYEMDPDYELGETHVWVGSGTNLLPTEKKRKMILQHQVNLITMVNESSNVNGLSGNIWIAAHSGVCWEVE